MHPPSQTEKNNRTPHQASFPASNRSLACPVFTLSAGIAAESFHFSGSASACEGLTADGQKGVAVELAVPLSALGLEAGDEVMLDVVLRGNGLNDGFTHADGDDPSTWMKIRLR